MTTSPVIRQQRGDLIKLTVFLCVAAVFTVWVAAVTGEVRLRDTSGYSAVFQDVSGLERGDDVRIAGVVVGTVKAIDVRSDSTVLVSFDVEEGNHLNSSTRATVQYRNLIGDRVVQLARPDAGGAVLSPGSTIPVERTGAALDLDTLLNGFKPLFQGLSPAQVNELSEQLIRVLQGQESALASLVEHVASFSSTLADRESLITSVIGNLNTVLGSVDDHRDTVGALVDNLATVVTGLESQDDEILDAAERIDTLAAEASTLVAEGRGDLHADLVGLRQTTEGLNKNAGVLEDVLNALPLHYAKIQNTASYGNFFNFFLCGVRVQVGSSQAPVLTPWIYSDVDRCS